MRAGDGLGDGAERGKDLAAIGKAAVEHGDLEWLSLVQAPQDSAGGRQTRVWYIWRTAHPSPPQPTSAQGVQVQLGRVVVVVEVVVEVVVVVVGLVDVVLVGVVVVVGAGQLASATQRFVSLKPQGLQPSGLQVRV